VPGARATGFVYLLEAVGSMLGGILFGFVFVHLFPAFGTLAWVAILNALSSFLLLRSSRSPWILVSLPALLAAGGLFSLGSPLCERLEEGTIREEWKGYQLVETARTLYGTLAVTEEQGQRNLYENGLIVSALPDRLGSEEWVHFTFLEHPDPRRVLLIGGGVGGAVVEALKYPVETVLYIELDPALVPFSRTFLPGTDVRALADRRVRLLQGDARRLIRDRRTGPLDIVLIGLPEPYTAQINRFYTVEFFEELKRVMTPQGVVALRITSGENYLSPRMAEYNASIYGSLKKVFRSVVLVPGNQLLLVASPSGDYLSVDSQTLSRRLRERGIATEFVNEFYLPTRFYPERIDFVSRVLAEQRMVRLNRDFAPISYYYDFVLWSTQFRAGVEAVFGFFQTLTLGRVLIAVSVAALILVLVSNQIRSVAVPLAVGVIGLAGMVAELLLLFGFQVLYGYVYHLIGLIVAVFMLGLAAGTLQMNKTLRSGQSDRRSLAAIGLGLAAYCFSLPVCLSLLAGLSPPSWVIGCSIALLTMAGAFLVGLSFPLANAIQLRSDLRVGEVAGVLYGADVLGGCLGAALFTIYFLPLLGVWGTGIALTGMSLLVPLLTIQPR